MANHEIVVRSEEGAYQEFYATGLIDDLGLRPERAPLLMVVYDAGDCDTPKTWRDLYTACYDAHQMYDGWLTGDTLSFKGQTFARIISFHVAAELPAAPDQRLP